MTTKYYFSVVAFPSDPVSKKLASQSLPEGALVIEGRQTIYSLYQTSKRENRDFDTGNNQFIRLRSFASREEAEIWVNQQENRSKPVQNQSMWMQAIEQQMDAINIIKRVFSIAESNPAQARAVKEHGFIVDKALLNRAMPFAWSRETIRAVLEASRSIPLETRFDHWSLETNAAWWWFEEPLPFKTINLPNIPDGGLVRAIVFGWIGFERTFPGGTDINEIMKHVDNLSLACSAWVDAHGTIENCSLTPSQTWIWEPGETLKHVIERSAVLHEQQYGPGGKFENQPKIGVDAFLKAVEGLSRFILAGMAWIKQRVVTLEPGHIERHRRKALNRLLLNQVEDVKIVRLRRMHSEPSDPNKHRSVDWQCRWIVDGHWRNQRVGPGRKETQLTFIHPYVKGPDDKPLREPKHTVYLVNR